MAVLACFGLVVIYRIDEREVIVDVIKVSHRSDAYG